MNFSIDAAALQKAVKALSSIVSFNADDFTGAFLLEAFDNQVVFTANNGSNALVFKTSLAEIAEEGTTVIPYSRVSSFVSSYKLWDGKLGVKLFNISSDKRNIKITTESFYTPNKSSKGDSKLSTLDSAIIPKPYNPTSETFRITSNIFKEAVNKVFSIIDPKVDQGFPALRGMCIKFNNDSIIFVGSDGVALSEYRTDNKSEHKAGVYILSHSFVSGLKPLLYNDVSLCWEIKENKVSVTFGDIVYTGRLLIGHDFPLYENQINDFCSHINLSKEFFVSSLASFKSSLSPEDNSRIILELKDKLFSIYNDYVRVDTELDIAGGLSIKSDVDGVRLANIVGSIRDDYIILKFHEKSEHIILDSSTFNNQKSIIRTLSSR